MYAQNVRTTVFLSQVKATKLNKTIFETSERSFEGFPFSVGTHGFVVYPCNVV